MKLNSFRVTLFLAVALLLLLSHDGLEARKEEKEAPKIPELQVTGLPEAISAKAFLVKDVGTGKVIVEQSSELVLPIASVTKLFTATAIWQDYDINTTSTIQVSDVETLGEAGGLQTGQIYSFHDLLFPLLLESSNDAGAVLERETSGEVVEKMQDLSQDQGLKATIFSDASGLSAGNVSTAKELAEFVIYLNQTVPHILDITSLPRYVNTYGTISNNNPIIDKTYRGGKHGYTEIANRTFVGIFKETISGKEREVVYVVLGSDNLVNDINILRTFTSKQVTFK